MSSTVVMIFDDALYALWNLIMLVNSSARSEVDASSFNESIYPAPSDPGGLIANAPDSSEI